jgi:peptide/nickel transport system substrate-binding protein
MSRKISHNLSRREFLYLSGLGLTATGLASLPGLGHGGETKPKYGGRLRIGERYGSTGLDAHKNQFFMDYQNYCLMYNALTQMGTSPEMRIYPDLAESWEISKDGREYIFALREKVRFHHGKELDSGDVKYSIERVMDPKTQSPRASAYRWIDSVSALDKYHVKFNFKEPFGPFLSTLTIQDCPIIPAGWEPTGTKPAPGTGPFVLKSFVANETTEFSRFDQYWELDQKTGDRLPYLDSIHVRKIVDETVRWTALRAADLDFIINPPYKTAVLAMKDPQPGIVVAPTQPAGTVFIYFNVSKPPFDNPKVRHAVAYAIDKEELVKAALWGFGETVNDQPFLDRSRMFIPVKDKGVDLARAKQLLAEAGYAKGFSTEFLQDQTTMYLKSSEYVVGALRKIGIEGTIKVLDRAPWTLSMRKGEFSISTRGDSERLDPDDAFFLYLHSDEIGKNNYSRYSNKEFDSLLEKGRTCWQWKDRLPFYKKAVEIIREELPILYLAKQKNPIAYRD